LGLTLILSFLIGFFTIRILLPFLAANKVSLIFQSFLGLGLGIGISSVLDFYWLFIFKSWSTWLLLLELSILLLVFLLALFQIRGNDRRIIGFPPSNPSEKYPSLLKIGFFVLLIYGLIAFFLLIYVNPHGRWDAWYIWNMRARFLYRAKNWIDAFSPVLAHSDYPPLLPLNIARYWFQLKNETIRVPALIAFCFTFGSVGLIVSSFFIFSNKIKGYLAGMILVGTPFFLFLGADQIADNPIAFYFLATVILFYVYDMMPNLGVGFLILAGAMAGFSGWTKNEGLLFIVAIPLARLFVPKQDWRMYGKTMIFYLLGLFPILITILIFKTYVAPQNDLWSNQGFVSLLNKLIDFKRYIQIGKAFGSTLYNFGYWPTFSLNALLIVYAFLFGFSWSRLRKDLLFFLVLFLIMFVGYFFVFVLSPHDLSWHLRTALERLCLQFWPSLLFVYFLLKPYSQELAK
jgi:hypothetical protein